LNFPDKCGVYEKKKKKKKKIEGKRELCACSLLPL